MTQLAHASTPQEQERLLEQAALSPESVPALLDEARQRMGSAPAEAFPYTQWAVAIAERRQDSALQANAYRVQGQVLRALSDHAGAVAAFEEAAQRAQAAQNPLLAAQVQIGAIDSLGMLGCYQEAIALAHQLETTFHTLGAEEEAAKVVFNAGSLHFRQDRYREALDCYRRAETIFERGGNPAILAQVKSNCANALTHLNRLDEALTLYEEASRFFTAAQRELEGAVVDTNAGYLHAVSGRYADALALLTRAQAVFEQHHREHELARCEIDLAEAYHALNLDTEAFACVERALHIFAELPLDYDQARAERLKATLWMRQYRPTEALRSLERAGAIFQEQKNALQMAHLALVRAEIERLLGQTDTALHSAQVAERGFRRAKLAGWAAEARFLQADIALERGEDATRRMQRVALTARQQRRGWLEVRAEQALGRDATAKRQVAKAFHHYRASMEALEAVRTHIPPEDLHIAFLRDKRNVYEEFVGVLLARGWKRDIAEALEVVERAKSRLLLEKVQAALERQPETQGTSEQTQRLAQLRAALSRAYHQTHTLDTEGTRRLTGSAPPLDGPTLTALEQSYAQALREQELQTFTQTATPFRLPTVASVETLQAALSPKETLLEFCCVGDEVCAFVVGSERLLVRRGVASLREVTAAARRWRCYLQKSNRNAEYGDRFLHSFQAGAESALLRLYDLLLRPLEGALTTERVILVPHGLLHSLPFHAFFDGEQYALDRWEFLFAPSAAIWQACLASPRNLPRGRGAALLMGLPLPPLEHIGEELDALARLLPDAQTYTSEQATLKTFYEQAGNCRILHLATHALFREDNPLFSGLQFADGWLLARDLYTRHLPCELATLSACHTGVTATQTGDERLGLIRGFLAAGARSVLASLWAADDPTTAHLMTRFYTHWTQGSSKAAALRTAQREVRTHFPHPYHWAAFLLLGEG